MVSVGSRTWGFQRTHYRIPKIQDGGDPPSWKSTWRRGLSDLDKILQTGAEWHADCGDNGRNRNQKSNSNMANVWRIQWHVIPEPRVTLQGAATGRIQWHVIADQSHVSLCMVGLLSLSEFTVMIPEPYATMAGCSHLAKSMSWSCYIAWCNNFIRHIPVLKIVFRHILFFLFS